MIELLTVEQYIIIDHLSIINWPPNSYVNNCNTNLHNDTCTNNKKSNKITLTNTEQITNNISMDLVICLIVTCNLRTSETYRNGSPCLTRAVSSFSALPTLDHKSCSVGPGSRKELHMIYGSFQWIKSEQDGYQ